MGYFFNHKIAPKNKLTTKRLLDYLFELCLLSSSTKLISKMLENMEKSFGSNTEACCLLFYTFYIGL